MIAAPALDLLTTELDDCHIEVCELVRLTLIFTLRLIDPQLAASRVTEVDPVAPRLLAKTLLSPSDGPPKLSDLTSVALVAPDVAALLSAI